MSNQTSAGGVIKFAKFDLPHCMGHMGQHEL